MLPVLGIVPAYHPAPCVPHWFPLRADVGIIVPPGAVNRTHVVLEVKAFESHTLPPPFDDNRVASLIVVYELQPVTGVVVDVVVVVVVVAECRGKHLDDE